MGFLERKTVGIFELAIVSIYVGKSLSHKVPSLDGLFVCIYDGDGDFAGDFDSNVDG